MTTATAATIDEFDSFCFAQDHSLINPSTKAGRNLFKELTKILIEDKDRFKGHSTEVERFRKHLKEIQSRINVQDLLVFESTENNVMKRHDLAEAPEATSVAELHVHNRRIVWGFDGTAAVNWTTVKLGEQPRGTDDEKASLRRAIDLQARNQVIPKILEQSLDPDFLATLVKSQSNKEHLILSDSDNGRVDLVDGRGAVWPSGRQLCTLFLCSIGLKTRYLHPL